MEQNIDSWSEKNIDGEVISNLLGLMKPEQLSAMVATMKYAIGNQVYPIINPYVRVLSSTPRHTPLELVQRMLEEIPNSAFRSSKKTFVDPACGTGMILSEVARRLFENGHSAQNVLGRIKGFCLSDSYFGSARRNLSYIFKEYGKYSLTEAELDGIIKVENVLEKEVNMRFDYCIQNPPYQMRYKEEKAFSKNIYPDFVKWGTNHSDVTIALTPSRWFSCPRLIDYKRWLVEPEQGLSYIWHTDDHAVFGNGVSVMGGVSVIVLDANYKGPTYVSFLNDYADLTLNDSRILNTRNPIAESILEKVSSYDLLSNILFSKGYFKIRSNDKKLLDSSQPGTTLCYVSKLKGFKSYIPIECVSDKENYLKWKVLHRCADGTNKFTTFSHIAKPGEVATESWTHFAFDSKLECLNYISYFETNFYRFLMKCGKTTHNLNSTAYRYIPLVSFNEAWDDKKLAQKFGLTEEEVAYINEQVG